MVICSFINTNIDNSEKQELEILIPHTSYLCAMFKKGDKKVVNAWALYDWANSVYHLVITSTLFPIYYEHITQTGSSDKVYFLGMKFVNTALYTYALSFAFLLIAIISPLLSA